MKTWTQTSERSYAKKGERVLRVRDGKYRSRAHSKREKRKQNKAWQRRKWEEGLKNENFRVSERKELPQEEKNDEKTRGPLSTVQRQILFPEAKSWSIYHTRN